MRRKFLIIFLICLTSTAATAVWANNHEATVVPDASALILAPMGLAAIVAAERRRRRIASIKRGVGAAYFITKRAFDILLSGFLLLATMPIFATIAILVRIDSPGTILYKRRVIGKNGKFFDMYKFRSMIENAEDYLMNNEELKNKYYVNCKLDKDPRVTRIGKILRKTSLDELPQLINVFLGNMTFVGPRPIAEDEIDIYGPAVERFKTVTPGITGLWQTNGRSETSYQKRVQMDMQYIEKRSILLDLYIILATVPAVLLKRGAM
ncbi:MAG: sugar transferase [Armatimonadota bacterium]